MDNLDELAVKNVKGHATDEEREMLRKAGYTFMMSIRPGLDYAEIYRNGKRIAKVINENVLWY